ncbi:DoxX family protein [Streptomyces sp. NBC_00212]|uniref:DoxX family protein n=1 Tax=Streptomyces sp. NBC_00212 TaxID=2975684 RepID=UPI00324BD4BD
MFIGYVIVTVITIVANAAIAGADFAKARFVLDNMAEVGLPPSSLPAFAVLKAAGAVGLALGLLGVRLLGIAAAVGLVLFFLGAVVRHVQTRVYHNMAFPGTFLALSVASLALALAR